MRQRLSHPAPVLVQATSESHLMIRLTMQSVLTQRRRDMAIECVAYNVYIRLNLSFDVSTKLWCLW